MSLSGFTNREINRILTTSGGTVQRIKKMQVTLRNLETKKNLECLVRSSPRLSDTQLRDQRVTMWICGLVDKL